MPVGVTADASAIALPRSRTRTIACSPLNAPTAPAAVSSPTLCPATAPTPAKPVDSGRSSRAVASPVATSSGCAIWVSRMASASASVP